MKKSAGFSALVFATLLAGSAFAGPMEDAGAAYQRGDYASAMKLIRPLAEQGNVKAAYNLGTMYYNGEGTRRDYAEALKWYRQAASKGDIESARRAGFMYANGQGVGRDDAEAVKWYRLAADKGDPEGANNLAVIYSTREDKVQAYKWFSIAAERFPSNEKEKRDKAHKNSEILKKKMTPEQIAESEKLARDFRPK